ncbi:MAG: DUF3048 domain-containing protein [Candidatus Magasanikbacteria bacterium]|jgi:hypothetical protein|nr:DUF3048 domain-containing protein [Candidatus Parcubacteria bacterium]MBT4120485.1 DUF3048 domain-containing protein [Candidatus Magasanikbacteria bacterium]MBT4315141.1 DUF3048 domain-containing protein [Candidatus Magasanikbacteria bacterium]MBT4547403.1 DUF3048 domain-containing protein [Candidatus Magasanikbacteria bacterium]MBT6819484.1 DUF3048 domain-containing protein [Candidatus Magasanikbacteria bacterium]
MKKNKNNLKKLFAKYLPDEISFIYILAGIVFVVAIGLLVWWSGGYLKNKYFGGAGNRHAYSVLGDGEKYQDCEFRRLLDGVCVESVDDINPKLIAVMIENHTEARPQSGLVDASIVYEVPVEANYTRFLAIYPEGIEIEKAGPVRSARPYFLDWVFEYGDPMYMHVGGSPDALRLIKQYDIFDINEMTRGWYFWRSADRYAPHNVYTSSELWNKALENYEDNYLIQEYEGFSFVTSAPEYVSTTTYADEVTISFLPPVYEARWEFSSSTDKYTRFQMEGTHRDLDGRKIKADTIIVQHVESEILDNIGRIAIDTIGEGDVEVFYDGLVFIGTWKKEDRTSRTKFYNENGEEIKLKPGKIWIEVVNGRGDVSWISS